MVQDACGETRPPQFHVARQAVGREDVGLGLQLFGLVPSISALMMSETTASSCIRSTAVMPSRMQAYSWSVGRRMLSLGFGSALTFPRSSDGRNPAEMRGMEAASLSRAPASSQDPIGEQRDSP